MSLISELKEQLSNAQKKLKKLKEEKKDKEKQRKEGEENRDNFKNLRKKLNSAVSDFEEGVAVRTSGIPGNFGQYYREQIDAGIRKGKIKDLDQQSSDLLSAFTSKLLDLDDIIADFARKISDEDSFIQKLKNKLRDLGEFIDDLIPGGD